MGDHTIVAVALLVDLLAAMEATAANRAPRRYARTDLPCRPPHRALPVASASPDHRLAPAFPDRPAPATQRRRRHGRVRLCASGIKRLLL